MAQAIHIFPAALAVGMATVTFAGGAQAHAHLVASSPAANATGPAPSQILIKFSEAPLGKLSGVELTQPSGASVPLKQLRAADHDTLMVAPGSPLRPGLYLVKWHAVTADTHRTQGTFSFTVS